MQVLQRARRLAAIAGIVAVLTACGSGTTVLTPQPKPTPTATPKLRLPPSPTNASSAIVAAAGGPVALPATTTVNGSIVFPAATAGAGATIAIGVSNVNAPGTPTLDARLRRTSTSTRRPSANVRRGLSIGTATNPATPIAYVTLTPSAAVAFASEPSFSLALPAGTATAGRAFSLALDDPAAPSAGFQAASEGPATVSAGASTPTLTFAGQRRPTSFAASTTYTFALYSLAAVTQTNLYVLDNASQTIVVYPTTATGNAVPTRTLTFVPPASNPNAVASGIAEDAAGELYVVAADGTQTATAPNGSGLVAVYAPGASGNATPLRTIAGASTGLLASASDSYVDGEGNLWVNNASNYLEFAPGAGGNVAPIATLSFGGGALSGGIAVGPDGTLYAATSVPPAAANLSVFAPGATGAATPFATFGGTAAAPIGGILTLDVANTLYTATNGGAAVSIYPQGGTAAARTIAGAATGIIGAQPLAVDHLTQNLFVANQRGVSNGAAPILIFAPQANGNVTPTATIAGSNVPITSPSEILIGP